MKPITHNHTTYYLLEDSQQKCLNIEGDASGFTGELRAGVYRCPLTPENAAALRDRLPWLQPQPLGLTVSFGFGGMGGFGSRPGPAPVKPEPTDP